MTDIAEVKRIPVAGKQRMTPSEAFVETLVAQGVQNVFGIVGSAYMDALDLFPAAGIRFIPTVHEQGSAHMADGYYRVTGQARRVHRPERSGHHQLRHRDRRGLLGAQRRSWRSRPKPARFPSAWAASRKPTSCRSSPRSPSTRRT